MNNDRAIRAIYVGKYGSKEPKTSLWVKT